MNWEKRFNAIKHFNVLIMTFPLQKESLTRKT